MLSSEFFFVAGEREIGIDVSLCRRWLWLAFFVKASQCVYVIYLKQHSPVAQVTWKKITKYVHISLATPPGAEFDTPRFSTNLLLLLVLSACRKTLIRRQFLIDLMMMGIEHFTILIGAVSLDRPDPTILPMYFQQASPVNGPFCSRVLPCTVSNWHPADSSIFA